MFSNKVWTYCHTCGKRRKHQFLKKYSGWFCTVCGSQNTTVEAQVAIQDVGEEALKKMKEEEKKRNDEQ